MEYNMRESGQKENKNAIDLVKFFCSILVIMIHIKPFGSVDNGEIFYYLDYGIQNCFARIAVPFFFVSSGFFLYRKTSMNNFDIGCTKNYVLRILRLYLIWTLVYFPLSFRGFFNKEEGVYYAIISYIRNLFFSGSFTHLWYLPALICAVLLTSFLLYKRVKPRNIILLGILFYVLGLLAQSWFGIIRPLEETSPLMWGALRGIENVIVTTRNGLFEGFIFVAIGMCVAYYDIKISKVKALIGFLGSMVALLSEVVVLEYFNFIRSYDMFLFLVPATFFLFCWVCQLDLRNRPIYRNLRLMSSLIFYLHLWVNSVVYRIFRMVYEPLSKSCMQFICTTLITVICSFLIIKLAEHQRFNWLKKIYT